MYIVVWMLVVWMLVVWMLVVPILWRCAPAPGQKVVRPPKRADYPPLKTLGRDPFRFQRQAAHALSPAPSRQCCRIVVGAMLKRVGSTGRQHLPRV